MSLTHHPPSFGGARAVPVKAPAAGGGLATATPCSYWGKEDIVGEWGSGIWAFSETSATQAAQGTIRSRLSLQGLTTIFGTAVGFKIVFFHCHISLLKGILSLLKQTNGLLVL